MIPKNLKVGDKFTDGNRTFEITKLVPPLGYESRLVASAPAIGDRSESAQEAPEATIEDSELDSFNKYTKTEIKRLTTEELTKLCKKLGLETGSGVVMKERILDHLGL